MHALLLRRSLHSTCDSTRTSEWRLARARLVPARSIVFSNRVSVGRSTQFPRKRYRVRVPSTRDRIRRVESVESSLSDFSVGSRIQFRNIKILVIFFTSSGTWRPPNRPVFVPYRDIFDLVCRLGPKNSLQYPDYEYQPGSSIVDGTPNTPSCGVFVPVLLRSNPEWWRRTTMMMMTKRKTEVQPNGDQITKRLRGMSTNLTIQI